MCLKPVKYAVLTVAGTMLLGSFLFGHEVFSYISSSARSVRSVVRENVPVEFQLRRAKDLVNDIVPEMHANIRLIAQQEVEIESLKADIDTSGQRLADERVRVSKLKDELLTTQASFTIGNYTYSRDQVKQDLAQRFGNLKEAEIVLASKQRLLDNRTKSLQAAMSALERTRSQKTLLEQQIAALESQHQLIKAASVGSSFQIDNSKLAQSEKLISEIKQQLDVAERVLAHQAQFVQPIQIDTVSEKDLVQQVDEHLVATSDKVQTAKN